MRTEWELLPVSRLHGRIAAFTATAGLKSPSAEFFKALGEMPDVWRLAVAYISDDRVIEALKVFRNARSVELFEASVAVKEFPYLANCTKLDCDMRFTDDAIRSLLKMKRLRKLSIGLARDVSLEGIAQLKQIPALSKLNLLLDREKAHASFKNELVRAMRPTVEVTFD